MLVFLALGLQLSGRAAQGVLADFDGNGRADLLLRNENGSWLHYELDGHRVVSWGSPDLTSDLDWRFEAADDFDGDGRADVLLRHQDGRWYAYAMAGRRYRSRGFVGLTSDPEWRLRGTGDFDGDGRAEVLLRHEDGRWFVHAVTGPEGGPGAEASLKNDLSYSLAGVVDMNGDGRDDVLLRHRDGHFFLHEMSQTLAVSSGGRLVLGTPPEGAAPLAADSPGRAAWVKHGSAAAGSGYAGSVANEWRVAALGDMNGDGRADVLLRHRDGRWFYFAMNGRHPVAAATPNLTPKTDWELVASGDADGDGRADVLLRGADGGWLLYSMTGSRGRPAHPRLQNRLVWAPAGRNPRTVFKTPMIHPAGDMSVRAAGAYHSFENFSAAGSQCLRMIERRDPRTEEPPRGSSSSIETYEICGVEQKVIDVTYVHGFFVALGDAGLVQIFEQAPFPADDSPGHGALLPRPDLGFLLEPDHRVLLKNPNAPALRGFLVAARVAYLDEHLYLLLPRDVRLSSAVWDVVAYSLAGRWVAARSFTVPWISSRRTPLDIAAANGKLYIWNSGPLTNGGRAKAYSGQGRRLSFDDDDVAFQWDEEGQAPGQNGRPKYSSWLAFDDGYPVLQQAVDHDEMNLALAYNPEGKWAPPRGWELTAGECRGAGYKGVVAFRGLLYVLVQASSPDGVEINASAYRFTGERVEDRDFVMAFVPDGWDVTHSLREVVDVIGVGGNLVVLENVSKHLWVFDGTSGRGSTVSAGMADPGGLLRMRGRMFVVGGSRAKAFWPDGSRDEGADVLYREPEDPDFGWGSRLGKDVSHRGRHVLWLDEGRFVVANRYENLASIQWRDRSRQVVGGRFLAQAPWVGNWYGGNIRDMELRDGEVFALDDRSGRCRVEVSRLGQP